MASLIRELAVSGARKSDGSALASGKVFLYSPGTTTIVAGYTDDTLGTAHTTVGGGIALDAGGRIAIWINGVVDVVVTDSSGTTVATWLSYNRTRAEQVQVEHESYTGALTDPVTGSVTQDLGGKTDLDTLLTRAGESLGTDFEYKESSGATARPYIEVIRGMQVSVKDFGAVGNGIADDTTPIQQALNEAKRLRGVCFFDPGTYIASSVATLSGATGVIVRGALGSVLQSSSTTANVLALASCTDCVVENLTLTSSATSTGTSLAITGAAGITLRHVFASNGQIGCDLTGTNAEVSDCDFRASGGGAAGRGFRSAAVNVRVFGGTFIAGSGAAIEFTGAAAYTSVIGAFFGTNSPTSPTGILFHSSLTGSKFRIEGCPTLALQTAPIDVSGVTVWPAIRQSGNGVIPAELSFATGTTQAPIIKLGNEIRLTASSGGAGTVTIDNPTVLPSGTDANELYFDFIFKNAAGGAVTWDVSGATAIDLAAAIPTTAAHTIAVRMRWDSTTSSLREMSRADTVT